MNSEELNMSEKNQKNDITTKQVVYKIPGMDTVHVQRDIVYLKTESDVLTLDFYSPEKSEKPLPIVIFVFGFSDPMFGSKLKEMQQYVSWGRLIAASGIAAITYTYKNPVADLPILLRYLQKNAISFGIDEKRIGLWACSGNVPMALSVIMQKTHDMFRCAVFNYGYMLNVEKLTYTAEAAKQFGFVNPCSQKTMDEFPQTLPLFLVRCGQDQMPNLNKTIDHFLAKSLSHNLPITFVNHHMAPHSYDLLDDDPMSHEIIRAILEFLKSHLLK